MTIEEAIAFAGRNHRAILATVRTDGLPQLSPVLVGVDAEKRVIISTREAAVKTQNLRRDPRASLAVFSDRFFGEWAQLEGTADVVSQPDALELLVDYYRRTAGEHPDWEEYRQAMREQRRVLIRITVTRAGPSVSG